MDSDAAPTTVESYDLLIVGGPTHAFTMSRPATRAEAVAKHGAPHRPTRGIREWLDQLALPSAPIAAIAFDTRVDSPRLPGSAAKAMRHELRSLGFETTVKQKTFRVHGYEGPLLDGELGRAVGWVDAVMSTVTR
jgi:hypothetical protein